MLIISKPKIHLYIFFTTLLFFLILWFLNPGNYIVAASFILLIFVYYYKTKDIRLSLLLAYLASTVVFTGKSYPIQLVPAGLLPSEIYPFGYFVRFTISPSLILATIMFLIMLRDFVNGALKNFKLKLFDIVLAAYYLWLVISDYFGSNLPEFSLLFSLVSLTTLVLYFYIKIYSKQKDKFIKIFIYLLSAIIIFESLISFQQFLIKSPIGKTLELQQNIEYFGNTADEIQFTFRSLGTFEHANAFGIWLSSYLVIITLLFFTKPNYLFAGACFMGIIALVMTLSRSSWIAYFAGILTSLFILEKLKKINLSNTLKKYSRWFIILGIPLFIFFIFPRIEKSIYTFSQGGGYFRSVQLDRAFELINKDPIFGVGSGRSVPEGLKITNLSDPNFSILADVHNWYVLLMVEHGIPSLLIFTVIIYLYFKKVFAKNKFSVKTLGLTMGVVATLIAGLFQPYINFQIIILALAFL